MYDENWNAVSLLQSSLVRLSKNITAGVYDFRDIDAYLGCQMFVGDINVFSRSNQRAFHFVSDCAVSTMGYADKDALMDAGGLNILRRHYKKLEAMYWVRHLLALPFHRDVRCIDYIARCKVVQRAGKLGFEERRYLACNLKQYRGKYDIICIGITPTNLDAEAFALATAVAPDPDIRQYTDAMRRLCAGKQRLRVFILRTRKTAPSRIAKMLGITVDTVNEHLTAIYGILGLTDSKLAAMIDLAQRAGFKNSAYYKQPQPLGNEALFDLG